MKNFLALAYDNKRITFIFYPLRLYFESNVNIAVTVAFVSVDIAMIFAVAKALSNKEGSISTLLLIILRLAVSVVSQRQIFKSAELVERDKKLSALVRFINNANLSGEEDFQFMKSGSEVAINNYYLPVVKIFVESLSIFFLAVYFVITNPIIALVALILGALCVFLFELFVARDLKRIGNKLPAKNLKMLDILSDIGMNRLELRSYESNRWPIFLNSVTSIFNDYLQIIRVSRFKQSVPKVFLESLMFSILVILNIIAQQMNDSISEFVPVLILRVFPVISLLNSTYGQISYAKKIVEDSFIGD